MIKRSPVCQNPGSRSLGVYQRFGARQADELYKIISSYVSTYLAEPGLQFQAGEKNRGGAYSHIVKRTSRAFSAKYGNVAPPNCLN